MAREYNQRVKRVTLILMVIIDSNNRAYNTHYMQAERVFTL